MLVCHIAKSKYICFYLQSHEATSCFRSIKSMWREIVKNWSVQYGVIIILNQHFSYHFTRNIFQMFSCITIQRLLISLENISLKCASRNLKKMNTVCKVHIMWSFVCRIVVGAIDLFLKMRHKGETTEIEHLLCVYLKLLFSNVFSHKPKLKKDDSH